MCRLPEVFAQANARVLIRPGNYLVVAAEDLTKLTDDDINSTFVGSGAGAAVLTPTEESRGILAEYSISDPFDGHDKLIF
jgi:3-oxoacyl-[acyl-carrier-protein] synthase III